MRIFADLEFTDLSDAAALISLGAIAESGETFYVEVSPLPSGCSDFVRAEVIPHLENGASSSPAEEVETRFAEWLASWPSPVVYVDSDWDIFVLRKSFTAETSRNPGPLQLHRKDNSSVTVELLLDNTYEGTGLVAYFDALYKTEGEPGFRKHHSLDDARALRAAVLTAEDALSGD